MKTKRLEIRLSGSELETIKLAAAKSHLSTSAFLRVTSLNKAAKMNVKASSPDNPKQMILC